MAHSLLFFTVSIHFHQYLMKKEVKKAKNLQMKLS